MKSLELLNEKIRNFKVLCEEAGMECCKVTNNFGDVLNIIRGKKSRILVDNSRQQAIKDTDKDKS